MTFLNTIWLWGLAALSVPLAIHLLSRKEGRTIYIGSIRHLVDSNTTRFASLRLNELLLLLLRIIFILLIIAYLAQLALLSNAIKDNKWVLVEREMMKDPIVMKAVDSLIAQGYERRILAPGFPTDTTDIESIQNYWTLSAELQKRNHDAVVFSYNRISFFNGDRGSKPTDIKWIIVDADESKSIHHLQAIGGNSFLQREGVTNSESTAFSYSPVVKSSSNEIPDTVKIQIHSTSEYQQDEQILRASLAAIGENLKLPILIKRSAEKIDTSKLDWIFWLSKASPNLQMKNLIMLRECKMSQELLVPAFRLRNQCGDVVSTGWLVTTRLTTENVLYKNFTLQLAELITSDSRFRQLPITDNRSLPAQMTWSQHATNEIKKSQARTVEPVLAILILLTLLAERWLAMKRMQ